MSKSDVKKSKKDKVNGDVSKTEKCAEKKEKVDCKKLVYSGNEDGKDKKKSKKKLPKEDSDESSKIAYIDTKPSNKILVSSDEGRKEKRKNTEHSEHSDSVSGDEDSTSTDSEEGVIEDEDGALVTPVIEAQILKTLAEIKAKDPKVYDPKVSFFSQEDLQTAEEQWKSKHGNASPEKPLLLKEYQRDRMIKGLTDSEEEEEKERTFEEEQKAVLDEFLKVAATKEEEEEDEDDFLKIRPKNEEEMVKEDEDYKSFILENLANNENAREFMSEWFKEDGVSGRGKAATTEEQFLIEYVLNRGWVERETRGKELPFEEIIREDEVDEEALEQMEEFEEKYNFRHEQPGGTEIVSYGKVEGSLRREESKRKAQREARKKRKLEQKERQREELKRIKNVKKAEIEERLKKLQMLTGGDLIDLEGDFDAEEHDRKMAKVFNENYYNEEDAEGKPEWSDDEDELAEPNIIEHEKDEASPDTGKTVNKKAAKRRLQKQKKEISKYMDEYYELDYEDMIGDLPCRFKYQKVPPTTFGLKIRDILAADDADLNKHVSLKKLAPYRPIEAMKADEAKYGSKGRVYKFQDVLRKKQVDVDKQ